MDTTTSYYDRVKTWRKFFHETGMDCGAYLTDVPYKHLSDEIRIEIARAARRCGHWPIVPQRRTEYVGNSKEVVGHYWVLRDRKRL